MYLFTCKCGNRQYYGSGMIPKPCEGCDKCGTNFNKEPRQPHKWRTVYDRYTGKPIKRECSVCYHHEKTQEGEAE